MDCTTELNDVIAASCDDAAVAGLYGEVTFLPFASIDRGASVTANNVISSIGLKDGRKGISFATLDNAPLGAVSLVTGTYRNTVQHDLTLRIFVKNEDIKRFVNAFLNARVVAIVKNFEGGPNGEVTYEAYGWDGGLTLTAITSDTSMADGVVYEIVAGNDDTSKEKSLPKSVWDTDLETTEQMIAALAADSSILSLSKTAATLDMGDETTVVVTSNRSWTITEEGYGNLISPKAGSGSLSVTVYAASSATVEIFTFKTSDGKTATFTLTVN